jgi:hypothetical protein
MLRDVRNGSGLRLDTTRWRFDVSGGLVDSGSQYQRKYSFIDMNSYLLTLAIPIQQSISTVFAPSKPLEPHTHDAIRRSIATADDIEDGNDAEAVLVGAITAGRFQRADMEGEAPGEEGARAAGRGGEGAGVVHVGSRR